MTEALKPVWGDAAQVVRWVHESGPGLIHGCDGHGRVVVAIPAGPQFGQRLAAAFSAPAVPPHVLFPAVASPAPRVAPVLPSPPPTAPAWAARTAGEALERVLMRP